MIQNVYTFDDYERLCRQFGSSEKVRSLIGEKGSNLSQLKGLDVPVPEGFIVSSHVYGIFKENQPNDFPEEVWKEIKYHIHDMEKKTGLKYGNADKPLLLSCRCDAPFAMPNMLNTVVNIGLNDLSCKTLEKTVNRAFAFDSYRRLIQGYGTVVLKIPVDAFESRLEEYRISRRHNSFEDFKDVDWIEITKLFKSVIMKKVGVPFPQDPQEQLRKILCATFDSFSFERVKLYRQATRLPEKMEPSLIISQMVFGNNSDKSCAAVLYTRNPVDGSSSLYGEYHVNCMLDDLSRGQMPFKDLEQLKSELSDTEYNSLKEMAEKIEKHFKDPQVIEFIIDSSKIFALQVRSLPFQSVARFAAVRDMAESSFISKDEALAIIKPDDLKQLMLPQFKVEAPPDPFCSGFAAGNGAIVGRAVLSLETCLKSRHGPILFINELLPENFKAYLKCGAVVVARGSNSSFAALIARQLMRTAVIKCEGLVINPAKKIITCNDIRIKEGDVVTVTGDGKVIKGKQPVQIPLGFDNKAAESILQWADDFRKGKMNVYSVVSNPKEAAATSGLGADGVGMFPIESIFTGKGSTLIKALSDKRRDQALKKMEPALLKTITESLTAAKDLPFTIRLFKPRFSSFDQDLFQLVEEVAILRTKKEMTDEEEFNEDKDLDKKTEQLESRKANKEANPIFGVQGIRLNLTQPDFLKMQLRAILGGIKAAQSSGASPQAKILLPLVTNAKEVEQFKKIYDEISSELSATASIGAEIQNPRACLAIKSIAKNVDFIVIQPTELTETTFGCTEKYAESTYLKDYRQKKLMSEDPFETIDKLAVGELMELCIKDAKEANSNISVGIGGPLCGDSKSISFFHSIGANYIICPSTVVPIARLCSAQAVIESQK